MVVGAAGGWLIGKQAGESATVEAAGNAARKTRSSARGEEAAAEADASGMRRSSRAASPAEVGRLAGSSNRVQALIDYFAGLGPDELEDEARKLESLPMHERMMASFLLFGRWAEVDPTAAMSFSRTMGFAGMFVRPTILHSWASVDPANAAKYYNENPREFTMLGMMGGGRGPMGGGQGGAAIIAGEWARQDPQAALAWASTLTTEKSQAMSAVAGAVAKTDPRLAVAMLADMSGGEMGAAYRAVASEYGAANFNETRAWIRTLPQDQQNSALAAAIGGLSNKDPQAAARELSQLNDQEAKNRLVGEITGDWARLDPAAAAGFLGNQTDPEALREGVRQLIPAWVASDPAAALAYANNLQAGAARDTALQTYVWSNQSAAPAELIQVAETIGEDGDRHRAIGMTAARWMREDPTAARQYVETSAAIPDGMRQRILEGRNWWGGRGRGR